MDVESITKKKKEENGLHDCNNNCNSKYLISSAVAVENLTDEIFAEC